MLTLAQTDGGRREIVAATTHTDARTRIGSALAARESDGVSLVTAPFWTRRKRARARISARRRDLVACDGMKTPCLAAGRSGVDGT